MSQVQSNGKNKLENPEKNESSMTKTLDIFQHLKTNLTNKNINCSCENTVKFYCIPCKVSVCEKCFLKDHQNHFLIKMADYNFSSSKIEELFKPLELFMNSNPFLFNPNSIKEELINKVNFFVEELNQKIEQFKKEKFDEINIFYEGLVNVSNKLKDEVNNVQKNLNNYIQTNKKFMNLDDKKNSPNKDSNNTMFLLNYDIVNLYNKKSKDIKLTAESLEDDIKNYSENLDDDFDKIKKYLNRILFSSNLNSNIPSNKNTENSTIPNNNLKKINQSPNKRLNQSPNKRINQSPNKRLNQSPNKTKSQSPNKNNQNTINLKLSKQDSKTINQTSIDKTISKENLPINHFQTTINYFDKENHFEEINKRINKYNVQIETFKKAIFNMIKKQGNLKEVEKQIKTYENSKQKGAEGLFSQRTISERERNNKSASQTIQTEKDKVTYNNKDDVIINNPLLEKYFGLYCLDVYEKNFKMATKELQSSHADLMIKVNEDEEMDYGKAIEGTNEIQIYDKRNNKMLRIPVKLTRNPFGYTKFPIGCRSLLIGDKLYITGGRDETNEYPNVLIYERKRNKIRRIMDMKEARSYHTMIYTDVFETIMVFGGENKFSVEIFDPLINRWVNLPPLNISRSNSIFYFDKPRGIIYSMFGIEGNIVDGNYSDNIEFLDLQNIKDGWNVLDYVNKSENDLRSLMNIYPLNSDLILLYGGVTFRGNSKTVCIFNIAKSEINKIQPMLLENLRIEAKKSRKLSSIISGLGSKNSSQSSLGTKKSGK